MLNLEEIFRSNSGNGKYVRVSSNHPIELYVGFNNDGLRTLRFNGAFIPVKSIKSTDYIKVTQFSYNKQFSILFSCIQTQDYSLLNNFCEDMIDCTKNAKEDQAYHILVDRYNFWLKTFKRSRNLLDESQIMGLIAELLFLNDFCFEKYGCEKAINGWSGPDKLHKDFFYGKDWFEVKGISKGKNAVKISSIEQLDGDCNGKLCVLELEKISIEGKGISLNSLIQNIIIKIDIDLLKEVFVNKLQQIGYYPSDEYNNYVYNISKFKFYKINDKFPALKRNSIPKEITSVCYTIDLNALEGFLE